MNVFLTYKPQPSPIGTQPIAFGLSLHLKAQTSALSPKRSTSTPKMNRQPSTPTPPSTNDRQNSPPKLQLQSSTQTITTDLQIQYPTSTSTPLLNFKPPSQHQASNHLALQVRFRGQTTWNWCEIFLHQEKGPISNLHRQPQLQPKTPVFNLQRLRTISTGQPSRSDMMDRTKGFHSHSPKASLGETFTSLSSPGSICSTAS